jgi:hypothetical protein
VVTYRYGFEGFGDNGVSPTIGSGYFSVLQLNMEGDIWGIDDLTGGRVNDLNLIEVFSKWIVQVPTFSGMYASVLLEFVGGIGVAPTVVAIVFLLFLLILGPGGA